MRSWHSGKVGCLIKTPLAELRLLAEQLLLTKRAYREAFKCSMHGYGHQKGCPIVTFYVVHMVEVTVVHKFRGTTRTCWIVMYVNYGGTTHLLH